jgi:hypothetical protein
MATAVGPGVVLFPSVPLSLMWTFKPGQDGFPRTTLNWCSNPSSIMLRGHANGPEPTAPLQLPANRTHVTPERIGTMVAIIGATAAGKGTKPELAA